MYGQSFLTPYRTLIACLKKSDETDNGDDDDDNRTLHRKKRSSAKDWPVFSSVANFEQNAGAKLKALVKIIIYHHSNASAEPITEWDEENQTMIHPATQLSEIAYIKILVYFSFSMMWETIISVSN